MEAMDVVIMGERVGHDPNSFNITRIVLIEPGTELDPLKESEHGRRANIILVVPNALILKRTS